MESPETVALDHGIVCPHCTPKMAVRPDGAGYEVIHGLATLAQIQKDAVERYLASEDFTHRLVVAITSTANAFAPDPDRSYEWYTTPKDLAQVIARALSVQEPT